MLEFTKLKFIRRETYYEVFVYYTKVPDELYQKTGVKIALNHLNESKRRKSISTKHPYYEEDVQRIRDVKDKMDAIINHYYETYGEKPELKYVEEQFLKPFEVEKKKLDNLLDYYPEFLKYKRSFVSADRSVFPYTALQAALEQFQKDKNINLVFSNLDYDFYFDFFKFLLNERYDNRNNRNKNLPKESRGLNNNTVKKRMSYMIAFLKYCIIEHDINLNIEKQKMLIKRAAASLEIKPYEVNNNNLSLNIHEILELYYWEKCKPNWIRYKDCIVLQLLTGMRISDTKSIDEFDLGINEGYLIKHSEKTNDEFRVRLTNITKDILEKYNYKISIKEQKYNVALKKIFKEFFEYYKPIYEEILGKEYKLKKVIIEKKGKKILKESVFKYELASSKMGRVSFVSRKTADKDLSLKDIMKETGHREIKTVQKYMDMSETISKEDLNKLLEAGGYDLNKI